MSKTRITNYSFESTPAKSAAAGTFLNNQILIYCINHALTLIRIGEIN